jgi:hypothetical protein
MKRVRHKTEGAAKNMVIKINNIRAGGMAQMIEFKPLYCQKKDD